VISGFGNESCSMRLRFKESMGAVSNRYAKRVGSGSRLLIHFFSRGQQTKDYAVAR
jgi:hypothetical protein